MGQSPKEGNLQAPTRHALDWKNPDFYNEDSVYKELERVFDLCHGCRRCVSLCNAFPTLFDLVDESETFEVDGVAKADYMKVVDHCYLCDLCYMTKCPYTPPHEWNIDFPHLMLRAKALTYKKDGAKLRDRILTSTDNMGKAFAHPIIAPVVNNVNKVAPLRTLLDKTAGISHNAWLPSYTTTPMRKTLKDKQGITAVGTAAGKTKGKVALFATCYGNYNEPQLGADLAAVFEHNDIPITIAQKEKCCGMPKLELGNLEAVEKAKKRQYSHIGSLSR